MIVGIGVDVVDIGRFSRALARTPLLAERLFTPGELAGLAGHRGAARDASLAARFAAKEALAKALGAPGGLHWHDAQVLADRVGRPRLSVTGTVAAAAPPGTLLHVSMSHDAGIATATVVAETVTEEMGRGVRA